MQSELILTKLPSEMLNSDRGETTFALESFSRGNTQGNFQSYAGKIRHLQSKNIDENFSGVIDLSLSFASINTVKYIAREEESSFTFNLEKFYLDYSDSLFNMNQTLRLGIQGTQTKTLAGSSVIGPAVSLFLKKYDHTISSGIFSIPAFRKFYISSQAQTKTSQLWSSSYQFESKLSETLSVEGALAYDYFTNLGPTNSFQSGLRGNSTIGNEITSEFLYDYSIVSTRASLTYQSKNWSLSPYLMAGENQGAYSFENKFYQVGLIANTEKLSGEFSFINIQKNSLIAIYTPSYIDATDINGQIIAAAYSFENKMKLTAQLGNFSRLDNAESFQSSTLNLSLGI